MVEPVQHEVAARSPGTQFQASSDLRANALYREERRSLALSEAWALLVKSWPFIGAHRRLVLQKFALALGSLGFFLLTPWPIKIVIDNVINGRPLTGLPRRILFPIAGDDRALLLAMVAGFLLLAALLIGMVGDNPESLDADIQSGGLDRAGAGANEANDGWSLWNGLFGLWEVSITLELTQRLNQTVRTTIYERFIRSPLRVYADQKIGDAVFRVMNDSAAIGDVLYRGVLAPLMSLAMFALTMLVLGSQFLSEPLIPILAAVALPVVALGSGLFSRWLRDQSQRMRERSSDIMAAFEERIAQVQLIKAFGQEPRESAAVDAASRRSFNATLKMLALVMLIILALAPAAGLLVGAGLYHLMSEVIANRLTLGDVVLLASYGMMLGRPMGTIGSTWARLQSPIAGLRRVLSVLESLPDGEIDRAPGCDGAASLRDDGAGARQRADGSGDGATASPAAPITTLELREVSVAYEPAAPVLEHVTMALRAGELVALAGASGCGKTTLLYCIPRFLQPAAGLILVSGGDARQWRLSTLRERVGFVFQQETLFSATIADNIRYGDPTASEAQVRRAAGMAGAAGFIEALPEGYQTMLGRRGARLSVGQKQRVAIARALLRDPEVLLLDEPMAALDSASEAALLATLRKIARSRIVLIVAHRPQTLAACDRVHFLSAGTIAASGPHRELVDSSPAYRAYLAATESEIRT